MAAPPGPEAVATRGATSCLLDRKGEEEMQVVVSWLRTGKGTPRTLAEGGACGARAKGVAPTVCPRIRSMPFTFSGVTVRFGAVALGGGVLRT